MAGWISSKLKVAETLLQQIDQQAAESLRKNERLQSNSSSLREEEIFKKIDSSLPVKYQLPKKSPQSPSPSPSPSPSLSPSPSSESQRIRSSVSDADGDWTQLLSSPKPINAVARPSGRSTATSYKGYKRPGGSTSPAEKGIPKPGIRADLVPGDEDLKSAPLSEPASSSDSTSRILDATKKHQEQGNSVNAGKEEDSSGVGAVEGGVMSSEERPSSSEVVQISGSQDVLERSHSESDEGADVESDSASTSDSEEENRKREEMRKRREQMLMKKAAAAAVIAIKEREDVVAKLEGEKQSLEKILEDRERKQAQEATELQTSMVETMEAVEIEKLKHKSTRMEALALLAKLETTNVELAKLLAATQWNLEIEVNNVAELRQQVEMKELAQEEYKRRLSVVHQGYSSNQTESSKRDEIEQAILDAEYSFICDKITKLKEKAKILEENIELTKREMVHPTEVEVELKKRLGQLTDHLIQKQTQVEALSSEKASLLFRIEATSRMLNENGISTQVVPDSTNNSGLGFADSFSRVDLESGTLLLANMASKPAFHDRIRSGKQHLRSVMHQLDAIFSSGAIFLKRNPVAKILSLLYLFLLHLWVMYILMTHSQVSESASHGAVLSLETINRTSGS
ncbi:hypothetical protein J5N97_009593 [Dioscorea zingiberensis]|uniref:Golgin candidate 2 n=1 Tax=Dioscorea zingiberensis TaxID=325984 RepID=A0A9D5CZN1_9LILI|nr:hypothetical protein J5N97_009593 [Dioscorea zingiberensis]